MLMMMMLDYVNLLVEYVIMSVPILSHKDNYYHFIPSDYVFIGGGSDQYVCIFIYWYNSFVMLSCYYICLVVIYMYMPCQVQFIMYQTGTI